MDLVLAMLFVGGGAALVVFVMLKIDEKTPKLAVR